MNISLIGGIPEPIGGVTQHIWRLAFLLHNHKVTIHDLNPNGLKYPLGKTLLRRTHGNGIIQPLRLLWGLLVAQPDIIHIHASLPHKLPLLMKAINTLFPKARIVLTLHHGDLVKPFLESSTFMQRRIKVCLNEISYILSSRQNNIIFIYLPYVSVQAG